MENAFVLLDFLGKDVKEIVLKDILDMVVSCLVNVCTPQHAIPEMVTANAKEGGMAYSVTKNAQKDPLTLAVCRNVIVKTERSVIVSQVNVSVCLDFMEASVSRLVQL